jgi:hypothetical protein
MTNTLPPNWTDWDILAWNCILSLQGDRRESYINSIVDTAFDARTFQRELQGTICHFFNVFRIVLRDGVPCDQHGVNGGNKLPGKVQTALEKIGNDNRLSARRPSSEKCDKADGARATVLKSDPFNEIVDG